MPAPEKEESTLSAEDLREIAENGLAAPSLVEGVTQEDLNTWYKLDKLLEETKTKELDLRNKIAKGLFTNPVKGSKNYYPLGGGFQLQMNYKINSAVDQDMYRAKKEEYTKLGIPEDVVKWSPKLNDARYNALTKDQKKAFDKVVTFKPGTPSLNIYKPKRAQ